MKTTFLHLNEGWNAEPNAPSPSIRIQEGDLVLTFLVNPFQFHDFEEGETGVLRFARCERYRLGSPDDVGWHLGRCRFSKLAPKWGEFYQVTGDSTILEAVEDWRSLRPPTGFGQHFLFYFRDETFECVAERCVIDPVKGNSLMRTGKTLRVANQQQ
jgi:hypothetical protein